MQNTNEKLVKYGVMNEKAGNAGARNSNELRKYSKIFMTGRFYLAESTFLTLDSVN